MTKVENFVKFINDLATTNTTKYILLRPGTQEVMGHNLKVGQMHTNQDSLGDLLRKNFIQIEGFSLDDICHDGSILSTDGDIVGVWTQSDLPGLLVIKLDFIDGQKKSFMKKIEPYLQLMEVLPGVMFVKDIDGVYVSINKSALITSDFLSQDQVIGLTDHELWPDNAKEFIRNDQLVIDSQQPKFVTEKFIRQNGQVKYFAGHKYPIIDDGRVIGLFGNMLDITVLKQREFALVNEKNIAVRQNKAKIEFIRNMQHDIRTPFSGVLGMANLLYENETCPEKKSMLEVLSNSADELLTYCNDIIDYANIENGQIALLERPFDLRKLCASITNLESPAAIQKKIVLNCHYDDEMGDQFVGDPFRIQRIMINLVSNAIKFTHKGSVDIAVKLIRKYNKGRSALICLRVSDTGIGIAEDNQSQIFEKMTRVSPSSQGLYQGRGFGLKIVRQFTQELEGDLHLDSQPDKGTNISIVLPLKVPLAQDEIY